MTTFITALVLLVTPIAVGALIGTLVRRLAGGRSAGPIAICCALLIPAALTTGLTVWFPIVGLWDGLTEGLLLGVGILWAIHPAYADRRATLVSAGSVVVSLAFLEVASRLFFGPPPVYPTRSGPHLLLADTIRTADPPPMIRTEGMPRLVTQNAFENIGRPQNFASSGMDAPALMLTMEFVCSIAYESAYRGLVDFSAEQAVMFPTRFTPRAGTGSHVLHIGDSMVFGQGVARTQTFSARLEELQPGVQHINGGIPGAAPDDYLVVLRRWIEHHRIDLAIMYLFEGNDYGGLDLPHPCSNWQSLLTYHDGQAQLRFSSPTANEGIGLTWLIANSPLPYLGRALIAADSAAAAFAGSALASWSVSLNSDHSDDTFDHLECILRSARDELRAKQIPFVVVVLPVANRLDEVTLAEEVQGMAHRLEIRSLDAADVIRAAVSRGENPTLDGSHFSEDMHHELATWLHDQLGTIP